LVRSGVIAPGARLDLDGDVDDLDLHFDVADLAGLARTLSVR
jgi:hypothetical protein